jgi:hemerythrin-like domain-containing protein
MASAEGRETHIEPSDLAMLSKPLEFIRADHHRQRKLCGLIEELARAPRLDAGKVEAVIAYLGHDMVLHIIDEEEDLFPLLRRRCLPEDDIDAILGILSGEHADEQHLAGDIRDALAGLIASGTPVPEHPEVQEKMLRFAKRGRRHLVLEDNIILPIARARLTERDQADLARQLATRRGIHTNPR